MEPTCPQCGKDFVRRSHREGVLERLLSVIYVYPFRCQLCTHRFKAFQWGKRYVKVQVDRREYERIATRFPLTLVRDHSRGEGEVTDISIAGCALESEAKVAEGVLVQLQLQVPEESTPVAVDAAVVRSASPKSIGLQFLRFRTEEKERLRQFIRRLLQSRPR